MNTSELKDPAFSASDAAWMAIEGAYDLHVHVTVPSATVAPGVVGHAGSVAAVVPAVVTSYLKPFVATGRRNTPIA